MIIGLLHDKLLLRMYLGVHYVQRIITLDITLIIPDNTVELYKTELEIKTFSHSSQL